MRTLHLALLIAHISFSIKAKVYLERKLTVITKTLNNFQDLTEAEMRLKSNAGESVRACCYALYHVADRIENYPKFREEYCALYCFYSEFEIV